MGDHIVTCGRSNEASYGETVLKSVTLSSGSAELLQAPGPAASELKVEIIGDSITAGFATKWQPGQPTGATLENSDVYDTYARHVADGWGTSEWRVVARSGIPVYPYSDAERPMAEQWVCQNFFWAPSTCAKPWDFDDWKADVVIINLGTNDYVYGSMSDQQFVDAYKALVLLVKEKYPNALIQCLVPLAYSCFAQWVSKWARMRSNIETAVEQLADSKVKVYETGSTSQPWLDCEKDYSGDYTHPNVAGNIKFATNLLEVLTPDVRAAYPSKCAGSGSGCTSGSPLPAPAPTPVVATTSATAPVATTTTNAATSPAATTSSAAPAVGGSSSRCCYGGGGDCASLTTASCNAADTWCSQTADNCGACGGSLCYMGGAAPAPPPSAATPAPTPVVATTSATTSVATTTANAATSPAATTSTAAPAVGGSSSQCCYGGGGDCASLTTASCNAADTWCSQTADNCGYCGGSLCYMGGAAPAPPPPAATPAPTPAVSSAPSGGEEGDQHQCCYAACDASPVCNEIGSWCSLSSENCAQCSGTLCPSLVASSASLLEVTVHSPSGQVRNSRKKKKFLDSVLLQLHRKLQVERRQRHTGLEEL